MTDQEIKVKITEAAAALNEALREAAVAGLTVEVRDIDVTTMCDPVTVRRVEVEVTRVTRV